MAYTAMAGVEVLVAVSDRYASQVMLVQNSAVAQNSAGAKAVLARSSAVAQSSFGTCP